ncbi:MAG: hypothetical protein KBD19_01350 [Candidatus Moranbacteria bacterium]|nr:hypothetical protein [Candidatus Moranbacteria bacterium]
MEKSESSVAPKETKESKPVEKSDAKKPAVASEPEPVGEKTVKRRKKKIDLKKYRKPAMIAAALLAVLGAAYQYKGVFISAVVDGTPISRLSVIRELEKQAGSQALDRLITKKLVDAEVARKKIVIFPADMDAEVKKIEDSVIKQGGTLKEALDQQEMTEEDLREQLLLQKQLEKILGDKIDVTDEDVARYVEQGGGAAPAGLSEEEFNDQIREQLKGQKFNVEVGKWITAAKAKASISYYAGYAAETETVLVESENPQVE